MNITKINQLAAKSLSANTKNPILRRYYRRKVYRLSERYRDLDESRKCREACRLIMDFEPWPFSDPDFCPWPEDDSPEHYTLFPNPAGFVTGHPTAYVSAMIAMITGKWPTVRDARHCGSERAAALAEELWVDCPHRFDAKNWASFLALNGYTKHVSNPSSSGCYVGIRPCEGEYGLVVWYHRPSDEDPYHSLVSTRIDRRFTVMEVTNYDYDWVEIW